MKSGADVGLRHERVLLNISSVEPEVVAIRASFYDVPD